MHYTYKTRGTCSQAIQIDVENDCIQDVQFVYGCAGNTQGVARLVRGMKVDEVIERLEGIQCRNGTSCPDQLAKALREIKRTNKTTDSDAKSPFPCINPQHMVQ